MSVVAPDDVVKRQVAAHWDRRAPGFDAGFGHSVRTDAERAAWDRILGLVLAGLGTVEALDVGCGTGFLSLELAQRGHRVTGVDFAPAMLAEARNKAAARGLAIRFDEADAERLPFPPQSFDLVVSRHVLWTLPHPEEAIAGWIRLLRPRGRIALIDGQSEGPPAAEPAESARRSAEYEGIGDRLPFLNGRPQAEIEALLRAHGLVNVGGDPVADLIAAHAARAAAEGQPHRHRRRYVVWGDAR
ncbi:MAG TPA: class I SAM-dependent methyltransferase [Stellaceae bacterium]|nr:class I SAM-dependent methyltransferase [Stellaceae bacterium]